MQVKLNAIKWGLDIDTIEDDNGCEYQVMDVEQDQLGRLSLTLDINPIEDRLYVYQDNSHNWHMETHRGVFGRLIDESILSFLKELQATIPPIQIR